MRRLQYVVLSVLTLILTAGTAQSLLPAAAVPTPLAVASADGPSGGVFVPVTPTRLMSATTWAGGSGNMTAGQTRSIQVLGTAGVPTSGVSAVVVDLAAHGTNVTTSSYLTAWPSGETQPVVVSMYYTQENAPRSNTAVVKVGANGKINLFNYAGSTSVTVDIQGYFTSTADESSAGGFNVMTPSRIANTGGWEYGDGVANQMLTVGQAIDIQAEGLAGIPADATALFVNVEIRGTAVGTTWIGAGGSTQTSPVSMEYGDTGPNSSGRTVPLDASGRIRIKNLSGSPINFKVDVQGYFTETAGKGSSFNPLTPANVYSTTATGEVDLAGGGTRTVTIAGKGGIPGAGAEAVALTISVKNWTSSGTVGVFPSGIAWPGNSTVAFVDGQGEPANGNSTTTIVRLTDGKISIHNTATQPIRFTLVAQGWFSLIDQTPPSQPTITSFNVTDGELVDPLPPEHAFGLESGEPVVNDFLVSADGAPETHVTGAQGNANYPWSPGPGLHTLAVSSIDPAGNQSEPFEIRFIVREYRDLEIPVVIFDGVVAPNTTMDAPLTGFAGGSWEDVDTFTAYLNADNWLANHTGTITVTDLNGIFPSSPLLTWTAPEDPSQGQQSNVTLAPKGETALKLRNDSDSSVHVTLTMTGWLVMPPLLNEEPDEEDPSDPEDEVQDADVDGDAEEEGIDPGDPAANCEVIDEANEVFSCTVEETIDDSDPTADPFTKEIQSAQAAALAPANPVTEPPNRNCPGYNLKHWTHGRWVLCQKKIYSSSFGRRTRLGKWEEYGYLRWAVYVKIEMGYLTRRFDVEVTPKRLFSRGDLDTKETELKLWIECTRLCNGVNFPSPVPNSGILDRYAQIPFNRGNLSFQNPETGLWTSSWSNIFTASIPNWSDGKDGRPPATNDVEDYRIAVGSRWILEEGINNYHQDEFGQDVFNTFDFPMNGPFKYGGRSNKIRCDNMWYFAQRAGCRVVSHEPTFVLNSANTKISKAAAFYARIQHGVYGWGLHSNSWFTRASLETKKKNNNKICGKWKNALSCDEFPFATTKQGCWSMQYTSLADEACNRWPVPLSHNTTAGSYLNTFMRKNRILREWSDEQFYFNVQ